MIEWASAGRPHPAEAVSGDRCWVEESPGGAVLAMIDGLGHGHQAALAAEAAARALVGGFGTPVAHLLEKCHEALRKTRGAVMVLAQIDDAAARLTWGGLGNCEAMLFRSAGKREVLLLRSGILGSHDPTFADRSEALERGDLLVMSTDGIKSGWSSELAQALPVKEIAASILRKFGRDTDDATVLVARWRGR